MLKGIDPLLSPELLATLRAMGHGDEIAIVDSLDDARDWADEDPYTVQGVFERVRAARGLRINIVSPTVLEESAAAYAPYFPGFEPAPARRVALAYQRAVEGIQSGQTLTVW